MAGTILSSSVTSHAGGLADGFPASRTRAKPTYGQIVTAPSGAVGSVGTGLAQASATRATATAPLIQAVFNRRRDGPGKGTHEMTAEFRKCG